MAKILNTSNGKSPTRNPVDRALIRQRDFKKLETEIKTGAAEKSKTIDTGLGGFLMQDRKSEIHANRLKNSMSSISILPGGQSAETRFKISLKRDASQKDISKMESSFGGVSRSNLIDRPLMNRNKSFVEFGDNKNAPGADFYRKESSTNADLIQRATKRQNESQMYTRQDNHDKSQNRSSGATVALNPARYQTNTMSRRAADTSVQRRAMITAPYGARHQT